MKKIDMPYGTEEELQEFRYTIPEGYKAVIEDGEVIIKKAESENERIRKFLLDYAIEMIAGLESDISLSTYDGIKGHDPEAEAELNQWQKARAYLEKQKEQKPENNNMVNIQVRKEFADKFKEMGEVITKGQIAFTNAINGCLNEKEQKPAEWSEEDRKHLNSVLLSLNRPFYNMNEQEKSDFNWLHELPERFNLQPKQEWSEEDERMLNVAIKSCEQTIEDYPNDKVRFKDCIDWLKSLRPQPQKELSIEKAIQWLDDTFYFLDNSSGRGRDCEITTHDFDSLEEMYSSFRKAVIVDSQPSWKPSEEQMTNLLRAEGRLRIEGESVLASKLAELYEQLKKLM